MAVADEIKEQRSKMKDMSLWGKIRYIIYYYKWRILVIGIILYVVLSTAFSYILRKPYALNCAVINASIFGNTAKELQEDYENYTDADLRHYEVKIDTSYMMDFKNSEPLAYNNAERISNMLLEGSLDVIIAPPDFAKQYEEAGYIESMEDITVYEKFNSYGLYPDRGSQYFCVVKNCPHPEEVQKFYEFFTQE